MRWVLAIAFRVTGCSPSTCEGARRKPTGPLHTQAPAATAETSRFGPLAVPGHVVLEKEGRGKYVGVMLSINWPHNGWWGEGDWLIWTEQQPDAWPPDYHGTGSEEYFNSGWCRFDRKAVSGFVALRPSHPTVYSFHLNDAFQFRRRIHVVEEQMGGGAWDGAIRTTHPLWTSAAFWYALPAQGAGSRATREIPTPQVSKNGIIEGESLRVTQFSGGTASPYPMTHLGKGWRGDAILWWRGATLGDARVDGGNHRSQ